MWARDSFTSNRKEQENFLPLLFGSLGIFERTKTKLKIHRLFASRSAVGLLVKSKRFLGSYPAFDGKLIYWMAGLLVAYIWSCNCIGVKDGAKWYRGILDTVRFLKFPSHQFPPPPPPPPNKIFNPNFFPRFRAFFDVIIIFPPDGKYHVVPSGDLHVLRADVADGNAPYVCRVRNILTGLEESSPPFQLLVQDGEFIFLKLFGLREKEKWHLGSDVSF